MSVCPCGILDQGVAGFGRKVDHLVFIDCRGPRFELVPLPGDAHFWVFNTAAEHALVDGLYAARHRECMAAAQGLGVALLLADLTPPAHAFAAGAAKLPPIEAKRARHVAGGGDRPRRANDGPLSPGRRSRRGGTVAHRLAPQFADPLREQHARAGIFWWIRIGCPCRRSTARG